VKFRKLRIAWSVIWGLAAVLLIVLWVRSYWRTDDLYGPIVWPHGFSIESVNGRLMIGGGGKEHAITDWDFLSFRFDDPDGDPVDSQFLPPVFSFYFSEESGAYINVPHWFLALITGSLAFVSARPRRYSLRTLLIVVTLVTIGLGLIAYYSTYAQPTRGGESGSWGGLAYDCPGKELQSLPRLI
jgi:hypothetical protein